MAAKGETSISVVIAAYNAERHIAQAIESLLCQDYPNFEIIVVDDGSRDGTSKTLAGFTDRRLRVLRQENAGAAAAANRGISVAKGDYVARMDADDLSLPVRLRKQGAYLDSHPDVGLLGSAAIYIDDAGHQIGIWHPPLTNEEIQQLMPTSNCFCHGSTMFRRKCTEVSGVYREMFRASLDYDFLLRTCEAHRAVNLPEPLYKYRVHASSLTSTRLKLQHSFASLARGLAKERRLTGSDCIQRGEGYERLAASLEVDRKGLAQTWIYWADHFLRAGDKKTAWALLVRSVACYPFCRSAVGILLGLAKPRESRSKTPAAPSP